MRAQSLTFTGLNMSHFRYAIRSLSIAMLLLAVFLVVNRSAEAVDTPLGDITADSTFVSRAENRNGQKAIGQSWELAQQLGQYDFLTQIVQTTYPAPMLRNAGKRAEQIQLYFEGNLNTPAEQMTLKMWESGANIAAGEGYEIALDQGKVQGRAIGATEWEPIDSDMVAMFAPNSDPLGFLAAATAVSHKGTQTLDLSFMPVNSVSAEYDIYAFEIDGLSYANQMRQTLEKQMQENGQLPLGARLDMPAEFRNVEGSGELWIDSDGLPLRVIMSVRFPDQPNGDRVVADIQTDFSQFDRHALQLLIAPQTPLEYVDSTLAQLRGSLDLPTTSVDQREAAYQTLVLIIVITFAALLILNGSHMRRLYAVFAWSMSLIMVVTPLLHTVSAQGFYEQIASFQSRQAATESQSIEPNEPVWNPNVSAVSQSAELPFIGDAATQSRHMALLAPTNQSEATATTTQAAFDLPTKHFTVAPSGSASGSFGRNAAIENPDSDGDGLIDELELAAECRTLRDCDHDGLNDLDEHNIGTFADMRDSDQDGLSDYDEVTYKTTLGGKDWYLDPHMTDTNKDGLPDSIECPNPRTGCPDIDQDGIPDAWDDDNDNDGVPDDADLTPANSAGAWTKNSPFKFQITSSGTEPVMVDFQIRPTNVAHIGYAMSVLDWPNGDEQGQIRVPAANVNAQGEDLTFADFETLGSADVRSSFGDLRLVPMLEIVFDYNMLPTVNKVFAEYAINEGSVNGTFLVEQTGAGVSSTFTNLDGAALNHSATLYRGSCFDIMPLLANGRIDQVDIVEQRWTKTQSQVLAGREILAHAESDDVHSIALTVGVETVCRPLGDIPNGGSNRLEMVDLTFLRPYGISVRDKDNAGKMIATVPLYPAKDGTGQGQVGFQTRMAYKPRTTAGNPQEVNLVWHVQLLNAEGGTNTVHVYYDNWNLTGFSIEEDYGLKAAIIGENPNQANSFDKGTLWMLHDGLDSVFVTGRDANGNDVRDLGLGDVEQTIAERFGVGSSVAEAQRWGLPPNAFIVDEFDYEHADYVGQLSTSGISGFLATHYPLDSRAIWGASTETPRSLLVAQESTVKTWNDWDTFERQHNGVLQADLTTKEKQLVANLRAASFKAAENRGRYVPVPVSDMVEYFASLDYGEADAEIKAAEIHLTQLRYTLAAAGGSTLVWTSGAGATADATDSLSDSVIAETTKAGLNFTSSTAPYLAIRFLNKRTVKQALNSLEAETLRLNVDLNSDAAVRSAQKSLGGQLLGKVAKSNVGVAAAAFVKRTRLTDSALARKLVSQKAKGVRKNLGTLSTVGDVSVQVIKATPLGETTGGKVIIASFGVVDASLRTTEIIKTIRKTSQLLDLGADGAQALKTVRNSTVKAAAIGLAIEVTVIWAAFAIQMAAGKVSAGSITFTIMLATAIVATLVAVIYFAISMIPVVGQIIVGILGLIDALFALFCKVHDAVSDGENPVQSLCGGIAAAFTKAIVDGFYQVEQLVGNMDDPNRLSVNRLKPTLVSPENGFIAGAEVDVVVEIENVIRPKTDFDSGRMVWYDDDFPFPDELAKTIFKYELSQTAVDVHLQTDFDNTEVEWAKTTIPDAITREYYGYDPETGVYGLVTAQYDDVLLTQIETLNTRVQFITAGINRSLPAYLSEGYQLPMLECKNQFIGVNCKAKFDGQISPAATNPVPIGANLYYDILPTTLSGFHGGVSVNGGWRLSWDEFPVARDFDGDGLTYEVEAANGSSDRDWDSDGDRLGDLTEINLGTDPSNADSDGDGLLDDVELRMGTNVFLADSDGDGLLDGDELAGWQVRYSDSLVSWVRSDPWSADADGDGISDARERLFGFSPNLANDESAIVTLAGETNRTAYQPGQQVNFTLSAENQLPDSDAYGLGYVTLPSAATSANQQVGVTTFENQWRYQSSFGINTNTPNGSYSIDARTDALIGDDPARFYQEPYVDAYDFGAVGAFVQPTSIPNVACSNFQCPLTARSRFSNFESALLFSQPFKTSSDQQVLGHSIAVSTGKARTSFSLGFWLKVERPLSSKTHVVLGDPIGTTHSVSNHPPTLRYSGETLWLEYSTGSSLIELEASGKLTPQAWHFVVLSYDANDQVVSLFLDGEQSSRNGRLSLGNFGGNNTQAFEFGGGLGRCAINSGACSTTRSELPMVGVLDGVQIFDQALNIGTVGQLYLAGINNETVSLKFDNPPRAERSGDLRDSNRDAVYRLEDGQLGLPGIVGQSVLLGDGGSVVNDGSNTRGALDTYIASGWFKGALTNPGSQLFRFTNSQLLLVDAASDNRLRVTDQASTYIYSDPLDLDDDRWHHIAVSAEPRTSTVSASLGSMTFRDVAMQSDGKMIAVGSVYNGSNRIDAIVFRFNKDGTIDRSFGPDGQGYILEDNDKGDDHANAVVIGRYDEIYVIGSFWFRDGGDTDMAVIKLDRDGYLVHEFGDFGAATFNGWHEGDDEAVDAQIVRNELGSFLYVAGNVETSIFNQTTQVNVVQPSIQIFDLVTGENRTDELWLGLSDRVIISHSDPTWVVDVHAVALETRATGKEIILASNATIPGHTSNPMGIISYIAIEDGSKVFKPNQNELVLKDTTFKNYKVFTGAFRVDDSNLVYDFGLVGYHQQNGEARRAYLQKVEIYNQHSANVAQEYAVDGSQDSYFTGVADEVLSTGEVTVYGIADGVPFVKTLGRYIGFNTIDRTDVDWQPLLNGNSLPDGGLQYLDSALADHAVERREDGSFVVVGRSGSDAAMATYTRYGQPNRRSIKLYVDGNIVASGNTGFTDTYYDYSLRFSASPHGQMSQLQFSRGNFDAAEVERQYTEAPIIKLTFDNERQNVSASENLKLNDGRAGSGLDDRVSINCVQEPDCATHLVDGVVGQGFDIARLTNSEEIEGWSWGTIFEHNVTQFNLSDFTLMGWVKRHSNGSADWLFGQGEHDEELRMGFNSNNRFECWVDDSKVVSQVTYTDTSWNHWACSFDDNGNGGRVIRLFRNGVLLGSSNDGQSGNVYHGFDYDPQDDILMIGAAGRNTGPDWIEKFDGAIDEIQVFDRVVPEHEIRHIFEYQNALVGDRVSVDFIVDGVNPETTINLAENQMMRRGELFTLTAIDQHSSIRDVEYVFSSNTYAAEPCEDDPTGTTYCVTLPVNAAEGSHEIRARAFDEADNQSTYVTTNIIVDESEPTISLDDPGEFLTLSEQGGGGQSIRLSGQVSDPQAGNATGSGMDGQLFVSIVAADGRILGGAEQAATVPIGAADASWLVFYQLTEIVPSADYQIVVRASDLVGNQTTTVFNSGRSATGGFAVDDVGPTPLLDTAYLGDTLTTGDTLTGVATEYSVPTGALLHYRFDEPGYTDQSGHNRTVSCVDGHCPASVAVDPDPNEIGDERNMASFDGANDVLRVDGIDLNRTDLTLSAWVERKPNTTSYIFGQADHLSNSTEMFLRIDASGLVRCRIGHKDARYRLPSDYSGLDHWACTFDSSGGYADRRITLYRNGELVYTFTRNRFIGYDAPPPLYIGANYQNDASSRHDGLLSDVRVYNRQLSSSEVAALAAPDAPPPTDALLWLPLTENPATVRSEGQLNATATCSADQCPTFGWDGRRQSAAHFSGTQLLQVDDHPAFQQVAVEGSAAFWLNADADSAAGVLFMNYPWGLALREDGTLLLFYGFFPIEGYTNSVKDGNWHHVSILFEATGVTVYVDGQPQIVVDENTPIDSPGISVGGFNSADFNVTLDDLLLYDRVLSESEIQMLAAPPTSGVASVEIAFQPQEKITLDDDVVDGLVLHLPLDDTLADGRFDYPVDATGIHTFATFCESIGGCQTYPNIHCWPGRCPESGYDGVVGSAMRFNGDYSYIQLELDETQFADPTQFTLAVWVNPDSSAWCCDGTIWSIGDDLYIQYDHDRNEYFEVQTPKYYKVRGGLAEPDQWYHVVTAVSDGTVRFYVNGELWNITDNPTVQLNDVDLSDYLSIGRKVNSPHQSFDGLIDDVRMYNRVLTAGEIEQLYDVTADEGNLRGWRLVELADGSDAPVKGWQTTIPDELPAGEYQISLRATDHQGQLAYNVSLWEGTITAPESRSVASDDTAEVVADTIAVPEVRGTVTGTSNTIGIDLLDALPIVVNQTGSLTITANLTTTAATSGLASFLIDQTVVYTDSWSSVVQSDEAEAHLTVPISLTAAGAYTLTAVVMANGETITSTWPSALILDQTPPALTLDAPALITGTETVSVTLTGTVSDNDAIVSVGVNGGVATHEPISNTWRYDWIVPATTGATVPITATVIDRAGNTTAVAAAVFVDTLPPKIDNVQLSGADLQAAGDGWQWANEQQMVADLTWESADGSGIDQQVVEWTLDPTTEPLAVTIEAGQPLHSSIALSEPAVVNATILAVDAYGQAFSKRSTNLLVDGPLTPLLANSAAYAGLNPDYWHADGCSQMGVDRRIRDQAAEGASLDHEQTLYVSWETLESFAAESPDEAPFVTGGMRFAWTGAHWDSDGDLFIYLDTTPGGSDRAYNPYGSAENTIIFFPPAGGFSGGRSVNKTALSPRAQRWQQRAAGQQRSATATNGAFGADYAIWVTDSSTAQLLQWVDGEWQPLADTSLRYTFAFRNDQHVTDIHLPYADIGISDPTLQGVAALAFASEESALRLWATQPSNNPANSARLQSVTLNPDLHLLSLNETFGWETLDSGICPNGTLTNAEGRAVSTESETDADVRLAVASSPDAVVYRLLGDQLHYLLRDLPQFANSADWGSALSELCANNPDASACQRSDGNTTVGRSALGQPPTQGRSAQFAGKATGGGFDLPRDLQAQFNTNVVPVGDGNVVSYTLTLENKGTTTATGVTVDALTFGPLRLPDGTPYSDAFGEYYNQIIHVGDLAPNDVREVVIAGLIDYGFDAGNVAAGFANLDLVIYDSSGSAFEDQIEWAFVNYLLDQAGPVTVLSPDLRYVTAGANRLDGVSYDDSPLQSVELEVDLPSRGVRQVACTVLNAGEPNWTCDWNAAGAQNGDFYRLRARATDVYNQTGEWTAWRTVLIDDVVPAVTLSGDSTAAVADSIVGVVESKLTGELTDNTQIASVDVCRVVAGVETCDSAEVAVDARTVITNQYTYEDIPTTALPLGAGQGCYSGNEIYRVFAVTDSFTVADIAIGLSIEHPYRFDATAWLMAPSGEYVNLLWNAAPNTANWNVLLTDSASTALSEEGDDHLAAAPYFTTQLRPAAPLSTLQGESAEGNWTLILCDSEPSSDDGFYQRSELRLTAEVWPASSAAAWSYQLPFADFESGTVTITHRIYAVDSAGNRTTTPLELDLSYDNVAPAVSVTELITSVLVTQPISPSVILMQGTISDTHAISDIYVTLVDSLAQHQRIDLEIGEGGRWSVVWSPERTDVYRLRLHAIDVAGNAVQIGPIDVDTTVNQDESEVGHTLYLPVILQEPDEPPPASADSSQSAEITQPAAVKPSEQRMEE